MPVDVLPLPGSTLNTKWKEPYASASINQKLTGIVAPGIYRGLRLIEDSLLGDRTVVVSPDATRGDHVAVSENADGYSITYRDASSGGITISLAAYSNATVLVTLYINYAPGVSTTGAFRGYTQSEFNALSSTIKDHLVILGTVNVPVSGAINSSMISLLNRTLASANLATGSILNAPLIRNPGFEIGETNAIYQKSSLFWEKAVTVGSGQWRVSTVVADTGSKSIEFNVSSLPITAEMSQQVGVETGEGELFLVDVSIKQLKTISSGSIVLFLDWSDVNDVLLSTTTLNLGSGIDSAFRKVSTIVPAPAGASSLRAVGIRTATLSPSGTGVFAYIDSVNVFVEPRNPSYPYPFEQAFRQPVMTSLVGIKDPATGYSTPAAVLRHDSTTPSGEGRTLLEPSNSGSLPPALALLGRIYQLGSSLLGTESNALKPRVTADVSVAASTEYTLMWESARQGESAGSYTQAPIRMYASSTGGWSLVANAKFDGANWNKDIVSTESFRLQIKGSQVAIYYQNTVTTTWLDANWLTASTQLSSGLSLFLGSATSQYTFSPTQLSMKLGQVADQYVFTPTSFTHDADILPASSNAFSVGSSAVQPLKMWTRSMAIGPNPTDDPSSILTLKSDWNFPSQTDQVAFDYVSRYFGIWSRKGHRFYQDWDQGAALPSGWAITTSGSVVSTTLQASDHRVTVATTGATAGTHQLHTLPSVKWRLTNGIVCRIRFKHGMGADFTAPRIGFRDVSGGINALTFGPTTVDGGGSHNYGFLVGSGSTVVGANEHVFSGSMRWLTMAVINSRLFWFYDGLNPDDTVSPSDSFPTSGSAAITVPTGTFNFAIVASGAGSGFGSSVEVDFVEIISGNREA